MVILNDRFSGTVNFRETACLQPPPAFSSISMAEPVLPPPPAPVLPAVRPAPVDVNPPPNVPAEPAVEPEPAPAVGAAEEVLNLLFVISSVFQGIFPLFRRHGVIALVRFLLCSLVSFILSWGLSIIFFKFLVSFYSVALFCIFCRMLSDSLCSFALVFITPSSLRA